MNFGLDDEQDLIVSTVRRFADKQLADWAADADRAGQPPADLARVAGELGFFVDAVPDAAGGMLEGAYSHLSRGLRAFELGRACSALTAVLEANVEPALAVAKWGSAPAQDAVLSSLADGGLAALAADARERIEVADAGDGVALTGTLPAVPVLAGASYALVITRDAVVLLATADAQVDPITPSGWRAAQWAKLTLSGTAVSGDFVLARGEAAGAVREEILSWHRANLAARAAGAATAAMAHAAQYGQERVQFGQPIGTFESLARMQDRNETAAQAARWLALHAAWRIDQGHPDAADAASRARDFSAGVLRAASIDAVQIYGGYGFVNEFPVEKIMRDARAFEAVTGNEALGRTLARSER